jgi:serine protease Do
MKQTSKVLLLNLMAFILLRHAAAQESVTPSEQAMIDLNNKVTPSVVSIDSLQAEKGDPFLKRFYGEKQRADEKMKALGTGVIIDPAGYVLTNEHVVGDAETVIVILSNGKRFEEARVVKTDPVYDLAVIKVNSNEPLTAIEWGDANTLRKGQKVFAFGTPWGIAHGEDPTMTDGIVCGLHRRFRIGRAGEECDNLIQTNAAINPGNSGGPLVNMRGQLVGINSVIWATPISAGWTGVGFAIPFDDKTRSIIEELRKAGEVVYGTIGVSLSTLTDPVARYLGVVLGAGVVVMEVHAGGPAEKAGIKSGDLIVSFGGVTYPNARALQEKIASTPVGTKVPLQLTRKGPNGVSDLTVEVVVEKYVPKIKGKPVLSDARTWRGLRVEAVTEKIAKDLGLKEVAGVRVTKVEPGSLADKAKVVEGVAILEMNYKPIKTISDFWALVDTKILSTDPVPVLTNKGMVIIPPEAEKK